mmetsp:Transcript_13897/g.25147  ORF Transcript_13897/g.25147 Transcript_13897/m.25147 type:complete len:94 (-) Transcript_13897:169-450(-)
MTLAPWIAERRKPWPMDESVITARPSSVTAFEMEGVATVMARVFNNMFWMDDLRLSADCAGLLLLLLLEDRALHIPVCRVDDAYIMKAHKIHR